MIKHIVLLQFAPGIKYAEMKQVIEKLGNLKNSTIPQIKSFTCGTNISPEGISRGYNFGFIMDFTSVEDRDYYLYHTDHVNLATNEILPLLADGVNSALAFDYTV